MAVYFWRSPDSDTRGREHVSEALSAVFRYIRSAPRIKRILLRTALFTTPASALWALLPIAASGHLAMGSAGYGLLLGALLGVVILPRVRTRLTHNTVLALSALLFGAGAAAAGYLNAVAVTVLMVAAGIAWIGSLSTFSSVMQLTLPQWVRARGLSTYLFVISGTQAIGAVLWGAAATAFGYAPTLAASAILLPATAASIQLWPLLPGTGQLDRTVAGTDKPAAGTDAEPEAATGPVTVMISYHLDQERAEEFTEAMDQVRLARLRTGATDWKLVRPLGEPRTLAELYTVPTWREYQR